MKKINLKCNDKLDFFYKYLTLLSPLIPLQNQERKVLSNILYWNDEYKDIPTEERNTILFSKSIRSKILQNMDISRASLDNVYLSLRKKNILIDNSINKVYEIFYDTHKDLMISFKINVDD